jgi:hypothetical protein
MVDFSKQIDEFERYGVYVYSFDQAGNIILNPSSPRFNENYVSLPVNNFLYDYKKIESFYNPNFEEFVPTTPESIESDISASLSTSDLEFEVSKLSEQNESLTQQLQDLISKSEQNGSGAELDAIKQVILDLRIQLGEGKSENDFETEFPYVPLDEVEPEE